MIRTSTHIFCLFLLVFFVSACSEQPLIEPNELSVEDDCKIGLAFDQEFLAFCDSSSTVQLLDKQTYRDIYNYSDSLINRLVSTGQFSNTGLWDWKLRIFSQEGLEVAFAAPGGILYISKALILFLENEADYVGVLAHAMAQSDSRFATQKLQDRFSLRYLIDLALGGSVENPDALLKSLIDEPYSLVKAQAIDSTMRNIICNSPYDIRSFSTFVARAEVEPVYNAIEWIKLYPYNSGYSDALYNTYDVNSCPGELRNQISFEKIKESITR